VENGEAKASLIKKISKLSVLLKVAQRKNNKNEK
jgi:hypothetical protein